jgi:hypothetical protein
VRDYRDVLTADVNDKGVLDVDVVKGCSAGIASHGPAGCYGACYAASIAKFRGLNFGKSVVRKTHGAAHARSIERAVKASPLGLFRIGTMGDPCHAWEETCEVVEWLSPYATPVIVTKHWTKATDEQFARLIACGAVLNTSISALDTTAQLAYRERQFARYADMGGDSLARIVSCDFIESDPVGARLAAIQRRLFTLSPVIDNPLRVNRQHPLVTSGVIRLTVVPDLVAERTVSISNPSTYLGHCNACPDQCGLSSVKVPGFRPPALQGDFLNNYIGVNHG